MEGRKNNTSIMELTCETLSFGSSDERLFWGAQGGIHTHTLLGICTSSFASFICIQAPLKKFLNTALLSVSN